MVWFVCHLLSFSAGGRLKISEPVLPAAWAPQLVRSTAALPLIMGSRGVLATGLLWAGVSAGNVVAGGLESHQRQERQPAAVLEPWSQAIPIMGTGHAVVRITGWPRPGRGDRWRAPARLLEWSAFGLSDSLGVPPEPGSGLMVTGTGKVPAPGAILSGPLELRVPPASVLAGAFDYRKFLSGRGLIWQARFLQYRDQPTEDAVAVVGERYLSPVRQSVLSRLEILLPEREAQLAAAVLLGVRTADSREISAPFGSLGLAHLFAVSGLHVGILLGILLLPGRLAGLPLRFSAAPLWVFIPLYLLLTGLPGSVVRAGGMGLIAAQARPLGRRVDPLRILGLLYWAGSLLDPGQNLDTGLQMSYLAAGGILLISRVTGGFRLTERRWLAPVVTGLTVSLAAQWFTLPVVASSFGRISLLSPLANLIAVPLFGLAVWTTVLALAASLVSLPLAQSLGALAWLLMRGISGAVAWLSNGSGGMNLGLPEPGPLQYFGWLGLSLILVGLLWHRRRARRPWLNDILAWGVLPVVLLVLFGPLARTLPDANKVVVWQFDVGQGDCALLVFPDRWCALIDTGGRFGYRALPAESPMGRTILPYLHRQGLTRIDAVLLTHGHFDHTGGALALTDAVEVGSWLVAGRADGAVGAQVDSLLIERPVAGTVLHRWRDWEFVVHYPLPDQEYAASENNWSLVAGLSQGGQTRMLWSGDLEVEGEHEWLSAAPGLSETQVWKAGHHGSHTSGSAPLLQQMRPQMVLISCGVGNSYRHPSHGPYLVPGGAGTDTIPLLRTDLQGSIRLEWGPEGRLSWQAAGEKGEIPGSP